MREKKGWHLLASSFHKRPFCTNTQEGKSPKKHFFTSVTFHSIKNSSLVTPLSLSLPPPPLSHFAQGWRTRHPRHTLELHPGYLLFNPNLGVRGWGEGLLLVSSRYGPAALSTPSGALDAPPWRSLLPTCQQCPVRKAG